MLNLMFKISVVEHNLCNELFDSVEVERNLSIVGGSV